MVVVEQGISRDNLSPRKSSMFSFHKQISSAAALARRIASLPPDLAPVIGALKVTNDPTCNV